MKDVLISILATTWVLGVVYVMSHRRWAAHSLADRDLRLRGDHL